MVKWIITKYQHSWVDTRLLILVWTDERIHAFLHYSLSPEAYSYITSERRGIRRLIKPLWELPDQIVQEQAQNGDTLAHSFYIAAIPNLATLTFFISATQNGIEARSVSIPIKVIHPMQGGADEVDCLDLEDTIRFVPWQSNYRDAVGCNTSIWDQAAMTGTGYLLQDANHLILNIGAAPGSIAQIYTGSVFDLALDHTLASQLRAIISVPIMDLSLVAYILHGTILSNSGYGFVIYTGDFYGFSRKSTGGSMTPLHVACAANTTYLLEAKYQPGERVEWWIDGEYIEDIRVDLPDGIGLGFHAQVDNPDTANAAVYFRRFMILKRSIWTGEYHGP